MAYDTANPPYITSQGIGTSRRTWKYSSVDAVTLVRVAGYFTNAYALGMRAGDMVEVIDNDASPIAVSWCMCQTCTAAAGADLSDGSAMTVTNSD